MVSAFIVKGGACGPVGIAISIEKVVSISSVCTPRIVSLRPVLRDSTLFFADPAGGGSPRPEWSRISGAPCRRYRDFPLSEIHDRDLAAKGFGAFVALHINFVRHIRGHRNGHRALHLRF
jgi:hypothetical protein